MHRDRDHFEAAGVELVAIGNGSPEQAAEFVAGQALDGLRVLVDPSRRVYAAAGAKVATLPELVGRGVWERARRARASGVRQDGIIGHAAQLGGVLIVTPDGSVPYVRLAATAADMPQNDEVLAAARAAASQPAGGAADPAAAR